MADRKNFEQEQKQKEKVGAEYKRHAVSLWKPLYIRTPPCTCSSWPFNCRYRNDQRGELALVEGGERQELQGQKQEAPEEELRQELQKSAQEVPKEEPGQRE